MIRKGPGEVPHALTSRQVDWWVVHQFVASWFDGAENWPMAGTPMWSDLSDDDPRKWASLLDAARHWALRVDTCQEAMAAASSDIAKADDWKAIAQEICHRPASRIPREKDAA